MASTCRADIACSRRTCSRFLFLDNNPDLVGYKENLLGFGYRHCSTRHKHCLLNVGKVPGSFLNRNSWFLYSWVAAKISTGWSLVYVCLYGVD